MREAARGAGGVMRAQIARPRERERDKSASTGNSMECKKSRKGKTAGNVDEGFCFCRATLGDGSLPVAAAVASLFRRFVCTSLI